MALARIDHKQSVPLIIAKMRGRPADAQYFMQAALAALGGADAEAAVAQSVRDPTRRRMIEGEARELKAPLWSNFRPVPFT
jgi:hypothetical protein